MAQEQGKDWRRDQKPGSQLGNEKNPDDFPEQEGGQAAEADIPPAGPHAKPDLINPDATPGAGTLPPDKPIGEADAATG